MKTRLIIILVLITTLRAHALTYEAWIASHGLTGSSAAETADPDADSIPNVMEFVLDNGDPLNAGPLSSLPIFGYSVALPEDMFGESVLKAPTAAPLGYHACLTYQLRAGIENVTVFAEVSSACPATGTDGSLTRWLSGQSLFKVIDRDDGRLQSICRFRAGIFPKQYLRLRAYAGAGLSLPPIEGRAVGALELDLGGVTHVLRTVGSVTTTTPTNQDVTYTQTVTPEVVTDVRWPWGLGDSGLAIEDVTRQSTNSGVLTPAAGDNALWTYAGEGSATLKLITPSLSYERTISTRRWESLITRVPTAYTSNSLRAHVVTQTTTRLNGLAIAQSGSWQELLSALNGGVSYTRGTACWVAGVDMTPVAVWNSESAPYGTLRGFTLVSPRHYIAAAHWTVPVGTTVHFLTSANAIVSRTVQAIQTVPDTDICVGLLDSDVPGTIDFARVLPDSWSAKLPTLSTISLPCASIDQRLRVHYRDVVSLGSLVMCGQPMAAPVPNPAYYPVISGDSGFPVFLIIGNKMVLLGCWYGSGIYGGGSAPFLTHHRTAVNAAMAGLGGGYSLTDVDLSSYTTF